MGKQPTKREPKQKQPQKLLLTHLLAPKQKQPQNLLRNLSLARQSPFLKSRATRQKHLRKRKPAHTKQPPRRKQPEEGLRQLKQNQLQNKRQLPRDHRRPP